MSLLSFLLLFLLFFPPLPDHLPAKWSVCTRQTAAPPYNGASMTAATYDTTPLDHRWACKRPRLALVLVHGVAMGLMLWGLPLRSDASTRESRPKFYFQMLLNGF